MALVVLLVSLQIGGSDGSDATWLFSPFFSMRVLKKKHGKERHCVTCVTFCHIGTVEMPRQKLPVFFLVCS